MQPVGCKQCFLCCRKKGDAADPNNFRPIAIIPVLCKLFSRLVFNRIRDQLYERQSWDQFGFRPGLSCEHALLCFELIFSKASEWNLPVWAASLDVRKAFDRILHEPLFDALRQHGVEEGYVSLLSLLYQQHTANVHGSLRFVVERGVRQGDVLSPLLFICALEIALVRCKAKFGQAGLLMDKHGCRLTNLRFADDMLILACNPSELEDMLNILDIELEAFGLQLHHGKSKVLTNTVTELKTIFVHDNAVEVLAPEEAHVYLGSAIAGGTCYRHQHIIDRRIKLAHAAFAKHRHALTNKGVSITLRMKLFDSVVTQTVQYGLSVIPLSKSDAIRLDRVQRKLVKTMCGWTRRAEETWQETGHRMKIKYNRALSLSCFGSWSECVLLRQWKIAGQAVHLNQSRWPEMLIRWNPSTHMNAKRIRGRPVARWDDYIQKFCQTQRSQTEHWTHTAKHAEWWNAKSNHFVQFVRAEFSTLESSAEINGTTTNT